MEVWQTIATLRGFEDYTVIKAPVPEYDEDSYQLAFGYCKENKCGCYDTNWGCNPAAKMDVPAFYSNKDYVLVVKRTFNVDVQNKVLMETVMDDMQRTLRRMITELRDNGISCTGFLDGPCKYCGECAYPEPCRFPDMKVASVSTLGINLKEYFAKFGEELGYTEDSVTLYGFIFVDKCD